MIDITQELFSGKVYPGDTLPSFCRVRSFEKGDGYSLTDLSLCAHNGTHLDAPSHFVPGGKTVEQISLDRLIGRCTVRDGASPDLCEQDAPRLLIKGAFSLTPEQAQMLARRVLLLGCEAQSIGDARVHRILLDAEVAILEGLALSSVKEGEYHLIALPMKLGKSDGAPVRAVLCEQAQISDCDRT